MLEPSKIIQCNLSLSFKQFLLSSEVLRSVLEQCVDGASARQICEHGDKLILEETGKVYKKEKEMKKGKVLLLHFVHNF